MRTQGGDIRGISRARLDVIMQNPVYSALFTQPNAHTWVQKNPSLGQPVPPPQAPIPPKAIHGPQPTPTIWPINPPPTVQPHKPPSSGMGGGPIKPY
jgi:hypothetical protein